MPVNRTQTDAPTPRSVSFEDSPHQGSEDPLDSMADFKKELLGENLKDETFGPAVHELVVENWNQIFSKGLPKEVKDSLLKKYPTPQNLERTRAPSLNIEVRHAIPQASVKRDEYQQVTQNIVGAAVTAQANLMSELLKPGDQWDNRKIFELANDAGRLTSYVQYHISKARRALITPMLTLSAKNALDNSPVDGKLFGDQFLTKMKDAAAADKLVRSLTKPNPPITKTSIQPTRASTQPKPNQGNYRSSARKTHQPTRQAGPYRPSTSRRSSSRPRHYPQKR